MKTKALIFEERDRLRAVAGIFLVGVSLFVAMSVYASVEPTVSVVVKNGSNATTTSALIGTHVRAEAMVASSTATTTPNGTVNFNLYPNTACTGTASEQNGVNLVNGIATSATTTLGASGLSYRVHFNGENNVYNQADSACVSVNATQFVPTLSLGISSTSVYVGTSVFASSTLANASSTASGSVTYSIYTNNVCTAGVNNAGTKTVTNTLVPGSDSILFGTPGTFYWRGVYSGDTNNSAATSSCGNLLTVLATSTPATTTPPVGPGSIGGVVYNDQNKNDVRDGSEPGLSGWTIKLHKAIQKKNGKWTYNDKQVVGTAVTNASGFYSFTNLPAGTYIVEEIISKGWKQTSDDPKVVLSAATSSATVDFSNIVKKANGKDKDKNKDRDNDNDDDDRWWKKTKKQSGNGFWKQYSSR